MTLFYQLRLSLNLREPYLNLKFFPTVPGCFLLAFICSMMEAVIWMQELKNKKILLVDDETDLLVMMKEMLSAEGFGYVYTAETCEKALAIAATQAIALYILDVNLPDGDGFSLYGDIRAVSRAPVIFLTARGEADDRLRGLGLGADDYIVKPFLSKELLLRIMALLRRTYGGQPEMTSFSLSDCTVDFERAQVLREHKAIPLTAKEFILLKKLWENRNRIVTNDALCMAAWGDQYYGYENTLMVHIRRLRKKIEKIPRVRSI